MRKSFMFGFWLVMLCAVSGWTQITIATNPFHPAVGTVIQTATDALANQALYDSVTAGTGGGKAWDFSSRTYGASSLSTVVSTAGTPNIDSFPGANLVLRTPVGVDTAWTVHRTFSNLFFRAGSVLHAGATVQTIVYHDSSADWIFPVAMGNQWTAFRHWTTSSGPNHTVVSDTTFYSVDAWGTAKYKTKTVACLRVMAHEHWVYQTFNASNTLINTSISDQYTANFVDANFITLVEVSKFVQTPTTIYGSTADGGFVNSPTDVRENHDGSLPARFTLDQNYPNPFNPRTEIRFELPRASQVRLTVFNIRGQEVKVLVDKSLSSGSYTADWDGTNQVGRSVASGIYFYRVEAAGLAETKKMVLLK